MTPTPWTRLTKLQADERALEQALEQQAATEPLDPSFVEQAQALVTAAAEAGVDARDAETRAQLRTTIDRWVTVLARHGTWIELPDLAPYARDDSSLAQLELLDVDELLATVNAGRPVLARRIVDADLRELAGVRRVRIVDCVLERCNLRGIELPRARLLHSLFADCDFAETRLPELVATSSVFAGGSLADAEAERATFCGTRFDRTAMHGCHVEHASFATAIFTSVDARDARLGDSLFDLAAFRQTRLDRAQLTDAVFTGATIHDTSLAEAELEDTVFSGADVRGSSFLGARLTGATFVKALDVPLAQFDADAPGRARFSPHDLERLPFAQPAS